MKAFLAWYGSGGFRAKGGLGEEVGPAPPLEGGDAAAWEFYCRSATPFVQKFGLMPGLIERENLERPCRDIFLAKLALIHQAIENIADMMARESQALASGDTMIAAERT